MGCNVGFGERRGSSSRFCSAKILWFKNEEKGRFAPEFSFWRANFVLKSLIHNLFLSSKTIEISYMIRMCTSFRESTVRLNEKLQQKTCPTHFFHVLF